MSRTADLAEYVTRLFNSPGGRKVFGDLERQADEKDKTIARRHEFVAQLEEARRLDREEYPRLQAVCTQADAEVKTARETLWKVQARRERVGQDAESMLRRSIDERRRAESGLRNTADPRLAEARSLLIHSELEAR